MGFHKEEHSANAVRRENSSREIKAQKKNMKLEEFVEMENPPKALNV